LKTTKLNIPNKRGQNLAACIDVPDDSGEPKAYAVYAHCFTCTKDLKAIENINYSLTIYNIAVIRFDMTGIGESEGNFEDTNFTTQIQDFIAVAEFLSGNYKAPSLAIGHSLGGCVAIECALKLKSIKAVAVIAAPAEPSMLSVKLKKTKAEANKEGIARRNIGGVKYTFKREFFEDIESYNMKHDMANLKKPLLILQSPSDTYTDYSNAQTIYNLAKEPKELISLGGLDHLMLRKADARYVGKLIGEWFEKYCG
jgi:alpha-beta hydrolase superfamily lysophospholipase